jgi:hypothetical protein
VNGPSHDIIRWGRPLLYWFRPLSFLHASHSQEPIFKNCPRNPYPRARRNCLQPGLVDLHTLVTLVSTQPPVSQRPGRSAMKLQENGLHKIAGTCWHAACGVAGFKLKLHTRHRRDGGERGLGGLSAADGSCMPQQEKDSE